MKTKSLLLSLAFYVWAFGLAAAEKPNIIVVLGDDVGLGNVSCCGADHFKTPHLDALAKDGELFDMSDVPFAEKRADDESAHAKLQAVLDQLHPVGK